MITEFQQAKLTYLFNILDKNNNTVLQLNDLLEIGHEVVDLLNIPDEDDERDYRAMLERKANAFFKRLTSNIPISEEGTVKLSEWLSFFDSEVVNESDNIVRHEFVDLILMFLFGFFNQNRDGYITVAEYIRMFSILGLNKSELTSAFNKFDINKDGRLSRYELVLSIEAFLTTDNQEDPGNWVFGHWDNQ